MWYARQICAACSCMALMNEIHSERRPVSTYGRFRRCARIAMLTVPCNMPGVMAVRKTTFGCAFKPRCRKCLAMRPVLWRAQGQFRRCARTASPTVPCSAPGVSVAFKGPWRDALRTIPPEWPHEPAARAPLGKVMAHWGRLPRLSQRNCRTRLSAIKSLRA